MSHLNVLILSVSVSTLGITKNDFSRGHLNTRGGRCQREGPGNLAQTLLRWWRAQRCQEGSGQGRGVRGGENGLFADPRRDIRRASHGLCNDHWTAAGQRKPGQGNLSASQKQRNRRNSRVRARVVHIFRIIKCQFGYRKARYKGLAKNRAQVLSLVALTNLPAAGRYISVAPIWMAS